MSRRNKESDRLFDNKEFKDSRLYEGGGAKVSRRTYNMIIAMTLTWGLLLDFFMCMTLQDALAGMNIILLLVIYFVVSLAAIFVIYGSDTPIVSFLAFTVLSIVMGLLLTVIVSEYTDESAMRAFMETTAVCLLIGALATSFPNFFAKLGRGLFACLVAMILVEVVCILIMGYTPQITSIVMVLIFSGYFGYDLVMAQRYTPTVDNAIDSAADIYIDVVNLFIRILELTGDRD